MYKIYSQMYKIYSKRYKIRTLQNFYKNPKEQKTVQEVQNSDITEFPQKPTGTKNSPRGLKFGHYRTFTKTHRNKKQSKRSKIRTLQNFYNNPKEQKTVPEVQNSDITELLQQVQ